MLFVFVHWRQSEVSQVEQANSRASLHSVPNIAKGTPESAKEFESASSHRAINHPQSSSDYPGTRCDDVQSTTDARTTLPKIASVALQRHECDVCGRHFSRASYMRRHERIHSGRRSISAQPICSRTANECDVCGRRFLRASYLRRHERIHAGMPSAAAAPHFHTPGVHECDVCGRRFSRADHLRQHERIHRDDLLHRCRICAKSFSRKGNLQRHQRAVHEHKRPAECDECGRRFFSPFTLHQHELKHSVRLLHRCSVCRKSFLRQFDLAVHRRSVHEGWRRFECQRCGARFRYSTGLRAHLVEHGDASAFKCCSCPRAFRSKLGMQRHQQAVHERRRPFHCDDCALSFPTTSELHKHFRTRKHASHL